MNTRSSSPQTQKTVLIVSYLFPPQDAIGAIRVGKLAKYLPQFGWEPIILTSKIKLDSLQTLSIELDETRITRTATFSIGSSAYTTLSSEKQGDRFHPNRQAIKKMMLSAARLVKPVWTLSIFQPILFDPIGWYHTAVKAGSSILKKNKIDAIFSSFGPSTSHFVASKLQRVSGLPWVADFRDLWTLHADIPQIGLLKPWEHWLEKETLKRASFLVTVSEPLAEQLEKLHHKPVEVIPNGFDESDYSGTIPLSDKFTISFTGNLYLKTTNVCPFLDALRQLKEEGFISSTFFEVRFWGRNSFDLAPFVDERNIGDLVKLNNFIPFKESIRRQRESTVLLLFLPADDNHKGIYSGKIFEYLGAGRPILSFGLKNSVAHQLLKSCRAGVLIETTEEAKLIIKRWAEEWFEARTIKSFWKPDKTEIHKYTRQKQAEKLATILDRCLNSHP